MKKTSIISLLICSIAFSTTFSSCEDMLSPDSERHAYEVGKDTLYSYWGILKSLQNVAERYVILGECRGDLVSGTAYISDSIRTILKFDRDNATDGSCRYLKASDYYHVINSCNAYLAMCDRDRVTGTLQPYMLKEAAQVEAIRAWVYLQLVQVYGEVPFYTTPLLTTNDIDAFMQQSEKVNADNLVDKLAPYLKAAQLIELEYGYPNNTGKNSSSDYDLAVCHTTKVQIPLNLILGDLYLTKGDAQSCATAAQYYYDYLSNNQGQGQMLPGGALPYGYYSYGYKGEGMDRPIYSYFGSGGDCPWEEMGPVAKTQESITAIPSSTNKLWGTVLRGVNEVFGYTSEISVVTSDVNDTTSVTSASVSLYPKYDAKQLTASENYFNLCKAQTFEVYIGSSNNSFSLADYTLTPDTTVGDARQYWVRDINQTYSNGLSNTEKFITKQNPNGVFTTVYPMIYRKAMVWLRYAEALNRAGYPSYAFAILKNGLCNNDDWYPSASLTVGSKDDYAVKDSAWVFTPGESTVLPAGIDTDDKATKAEIETYLASLVANGTMTQGAVDSCTLSWTPVSYENYTDDNCQAALYYLDRREVLNSPSFLNFNFEVLNGNISSPSVFTRASLTTRRITTESYSRGTGSEPITMGIHARGCGMPLYNDKSSSFDYVKKVTEKAQTYGISLTKEDIYSGAYDDVVQKAVEDLIVDEEALELAFEGCRFFDLMRVAKRRNDPNYLASRVAKRDASLLGKLQDMNNWYFKLPNR